MKASRWTPYALFLLGLWQLAAPATFGYTSRALFMSDLASGVVLISLALHLRKEAGLWAYWAVACVGVYLQLAPLLFWAPQAACYVSNTLVGVLAILFSLILPQQSAKSAGAVPPGWSYNPSSWPQRMPIVLLATVGWFISRYLAAYQLGYISHVWDPFFGSGTLKVITSSVSQAFPVSDAGLGAAAYTLEALLACKGDAMRWRTMPWMVILFGILVVPLGLVSILLILLQPLVVGAWCAWCLATAACMVVMVALSIDEVGAVLQLLRRVRRSRRPFWEVFWKGDLQKNGSDDTDAVPSNAPLHQLFPAMTRGVTPTLSLMLSAGLGIVLMLLPAFFDVETRLAAADHVLGALVIVISIISMAEIIRCWRYVNVFLGLFVLAMLCRGEEISFAAFAAHFLAIGLVIGCSIPRGKIAPR